MRPLDRSALTIPRERLAVALAERIARKEAVLRERDAEWGGDRVRIGSYMENIGWPELLGFDANRYLTDPETQFDVDLRTSIFWADNSLDDSLPALRLNCTVGMYFDMTLFGLGVTHTPQGVPQFASHPLATTPTLGVFRPHDFHSTGAMAQLLPLHRRLGELASACCPAPAVGFPWFHRGPLDLYIQMRTYERFVDDVWERPEFLRQALCYFMEERARWNRERAVYLGQPAATTTFVADDWAYIPFISPGIFRDIVLPAYRRCQELEGPVTGFHTCGNFVPLVTEMRRSLPGIRTLDVGGWNDLEAMDREAPPELAFAVSFINTFELTAPEEEQRRRLEQVRCIATRRQVSLCAQAMVRLHATYDEDLGRMNRFIELARRVLAG